VSTWAQACDHGRALETREGQLRVLLLLTRLPLAWTGLLECLSGLDGPSSLYRSITCLTRAGLIATVRAHSDMWAGDGSTRGAWPARSLRLLYPTDLGLAALGVHQQVEPWLLAQRYRLRRVDLQAELAHLPELVALYGLLGALARSYGSRPRLLAFARPWRIPTGEAGGAAGASRRGVTLPGYAALGWHDVPCPTCAAAGDERLDGCGGLARAYVLLPDLGGPPVEAHGRLLSDLLGSRAAVEGRRIHAVDRANSMSGWAPFPCLAIATTPLRQAAWLALRRDTAGRQHEAVLCTRITTWDYVWQASRPTASRRAQTALSGAWPHDVVFAQIPEHGGCATAGQLTLRPAAAPLRPRRPGSRLAAVVGSLSPTGAMSTTACPPPRRAFPASGGRTPRSELARVGALSLHMAAGGRAVLDILAQHPFLSVEALAIVCGLSTRWTDTCVRHMCGQGLARRLTAADVPVATRDVDQEERAADEPITPDEADEADEEPGDESQAGERLARGCYELTARGLLLAACQRGLTLTQAVRLAGFVGGGPEDPMGIRQGLLDTFLHTVGADDLVVGLHATARMRDASGHDDAVEEWEGPARAARGHYRPDALVQYRRGGGSNTLCLEYDRGTMRVRDYRRKFAAHYDHRDARLTATGSYAAPLILVVAPDEETEARIVVGFRDASVGRGPALPLLLTLKHLATQPEGLLGPIWRTPAGDDRGEWTVVSCG